MTKHKKPDISLLKKERIKDAQDCIVEFYRKHGDCCAGCDHWRWGSSLLGECRKSVPVSGSERLSMLGINWITAKIEAGHIITPREHVCGDFIDTYDWNRDPDNVLRSL